MVTKVNKQWVLDGGTESQQLKPDVVTSGVWQRFSLSQGHKIGFRICCREGLIKVSGKLPTYPSPNSTICPN